MTRAHITKALDQELAGSEENTGVLAEVMALGAAGALITSLANSVIPVAGAAAAGALTAGLAWHMGKEHFKPAIKAQVENAVEEVLSARSLPNRAWSDWLPWEELDAGTKILVPAGLPLPAEAGFQPTKLASYVGQAKDWAHPLLDGSRLHAHEYADGALVLHRDHVDPALGPVRASVHWLAETSEGNVLSTVIGTGVIVGLVWWVMA